MDSFNADQSIANVRVIKPNEVVYAQLKALEDAQWKKFFYCTANLNVESLTPDHFKALKIVVKEKKKVVKAFNNVFEKFADKENPCLNCRISTEEISKATEDLAKATACGTDEVEFQRQFREFQTEIARHAQDQLKNVNTRMTMAKIVPMMSEAKSDMDAQEGNYANIKINENSQDQLKTTETKDIELV